jgi:AcrR family transcriptional regulator
MSTSSVVDDDAVDAPVGLRERRRLETTREISDAALDLFERQGVHATTVDEIAHAAGISPRTFFRYFATKEQAAFLDDPEGDLLVRETLRALDAGASPAAALEAGWLAVFDIVAGDVEGQTRGRRLHALIFSEPALLAVALRRDAEQAQVLAEALAASSEADPASLKLLVALFGTLARQTFDVWARRHDAGDDVAPRSVYLDLRAAVRGFAEHFAG